MQGEKSLHASPHLVGGTARKGQQEYAARVRTELDEVGHPVGQRLRLPGSGSRNDEQGSIGPRVVACTTQNRLALRRVEIFEPGRMRRPGRIIGIGQGRTRDEAISSPRGSLRTVAPDTSVMETGEPERIPTTTASSQTGQIR